MWVSAPNYFFLTPPATLIKNLVGRRTEGLTRHGKYILAELDDRSRLLCHLGMTGQITGRNIERDGHVHLVLGLSGKKTISFRDVRKFGKVEWIPAGASSPRLDKLGPDALEISSEKLQRGLSSRRLVVKLALLDQQILAGVGNIYADEALFGARLSPLRIASSLRAEEVSRLARHIRRILGTSVKRGGSTINDYIQPDGALGGYQGWHRVYGKTGDPCWRCKRPVQRTVLAGRSTHYCPQCQT